MIDSAKVKELVTQALEEQGAFLVDLTIGNDSRIHLVADHKDGITLDMLMQISRHVEHNLDREAEDFALDVSSPGVGEPLKVKEQYEKNVGRPVKVVTLDGKVHQGDFDRFENDEVTLSWKERVPKPVGKGKVTVKKEVKIPLQDIKETSIEIRF
ncbi:MAG TPA: ribosome assembly cofactor RimP [Cryomorphaceae bacterium]|nr:ribosome assembly cofactor RimP [Owenweeksia sp.]MBF98314.1 ribosome assembly cofactor RimP [Owenweeksia sp.]HAD98085.1 ribosome assembly cofactor RimP [Cryomorphaceae bacterium]HBF20500.1 ribosome assembly cofactor RimP [Cryomorphaceae bacterium]HCQ15777.1 ribosome assembly cofactor RimP [Cryomorphaceae bacterium]|tara:strand:+ start:12403 stop:12867 length:465 start_codon:yes stop_codon:yes gene_type:complete